MTINTISFGHKKLTAATISDELNALHTLRGDWEVGAYKASNEGLYDILAKCLTLLQQVKGAKPLIAAINARLAEISIKHTMSTSLATKIVRCVFGVSNQRTLIYARVITEAARLKPPSQSLPSWINESGGIEEIRRASAGETPSQKKEAHRKSAQRYFTAAEPLIPNFTPPVSKASYFTPHNESAHEFVALLVRKNGDGTFSIVCGVNNQTLLNDLIAIAGKAEATKIASWRARPAETAKAKFIDETLTEEKAAKAA